MYRARADDKGDPGRAADIRMELEVGLGGRRSIRHSTRCFTASKPIAPSGADMAASQLHRAKRLD